MKPIKITLNYCEKHDEYWIQNCPNCMADDTEKETAQMIFSELFGIANNRKAGRTVLYSELEEVYSRYKGDVK